MRAALERVWPVLTPAELLHDLFGSPALLRLAGAGILDDDEIFATASASLWRTSPRCAGRRPTSPSSTTPATCSARASADERSGSEDGDEIRTYGHIVIDEVQDLTPMQLKMASRRSLNGSLTVVGDLAQATGPLTDRWEDVLEHLPQRTASRVVGLSVGYRIPAQIMELADRVMRPLARTCARRPPVRVGDAAPSIVRAASRTELGSTTADAVAKMTTDLTSRNVAVVAPDGLVRRDLGRPQRRRHRARPGHPHRSRRPASRSCRSASSRASSSTASSSSSRPRIVARRGAGPPRPVRPR